MGHSWVLHVSARTAASQLPLYGSFISLSSYHHTLEWMGFPWGSAGKESACNAGGPGFDPKVGKIPWRRERLSIPVFWPGEFHGLYSPWSHKESNVLPTASYILQKGKQENCLIELEENHWLPLQYSGLENSMDCMVHGVTKNQTQLSDFHFLSEWALPPVLAQKCPRMAAYLRLGSLEADLERTHSYECDLLGSLLRKVNRRLGVQGQKEASPARTWYQTKSQRAAGSVLQVGPGDSTGHNLEVFRSGQRSWCDLRSPLGTGLRATPREREISSYFFLWYGAWTGRIFVWIAKDPVVQGLQNIQCLYP